MTDNKTRTCTLQISLVIIFIGLMLANPERLIAQSEPSAEPTPPAYDTEQSVFDTLIFSGSFSPTEAAGTRLVEWNANIPLELVDNGNGLFGQPGPGVTGVNLNLHSSGDIGFGLKTEFSATSTYQVQVPVMVTLELPENGAIAPEERFTISTNWSTPNPDGGAKSGAGFQVNTDPLLKAALVMEGWFRFNLDAEGCWLGNCQDGNLRVGDLLGHSANNAAIPLDLTLVEWEIAGPNWKNMTVNGSAFEDFFGIEEDILPDPLFLDVLSYVNPNLSAVSAIGIATDYSNMKSNIEKYSATRVPKGRFVSDGWYENTMSIEVDLTNLYPAAISLTTPIPHPPYNGTLSDLFSLAGAKVDPTGKTSKALSILSKASFGSLYYNFLEMDLTAEWGTALVYQLIPKPPRIRILEDGIPITNWYRAGDDITITMPVSPGAMSIETEVKPLFVQEYRNLAKNTFLNASSGELRFYFFPQLGPVSDRRVTKPGFTILDVDRHESNFAPKTFTQSFLFPDVLSDPRSGISGGGGINFGPAKSCWQPDFLPSGATGTYFDDDDGCVISFWDFVVNGDVNINSYSDTEVSFTLQNSKMGGVGDQLTNLILNPQSDTSIQFTGSVRMSGFDRVDLFFDDSGSSGNHNQLIFNTVYGGFISNSLLRGQTNNVNQSDIVLQNGKLTIDNTIMELDNITVWNGTINMQDSEAELRNLQVLGPGSSVMRLTRDSLITTNSNASTLSSNLEIGNGSLVNVSGSFSNQGALHLEMGGWLTVLEGDPDLPGKLTTPGISPGQINIVGNANFDEAMAAMALLPGSDIDPVDLFQNQVKGSRLDVGVLLLSNGIIENQAISNIGGVVITSGGEISDSSMAFSESASLIVAHEPVLFETSSITGIGSIEVLNGAELQLDQAVIGDNANEAFSLSLNNYGTLKLISNSQMLENTTLVHGGHMQVNPGVEFDLEMLTMLGGTIDLQGTITAEQPVNLSAGKITGQGIINADFVNRGGSLEGLTLDVLGHLELLKTGETRVNFSLGSNPLIRANTVQMGGLLKVIVDQPYLDSLLPGDTFEFLTFSDSGVGTFIAFDLENELGEKIPGWAFDVIYDANGASIIWEEVLEIKIKEFPIFETGFEF